VAIVKLDLKDILEQNTIVFENIPDIEGSTEEDGAPRVWRVRPLTVEREHAVETARMHNSAYLQRIIAANQARWKAVEEGRDAGTPAEEDLEPQATAEQWAPIVAALVCEPDLDADYLAEHFHGVVLRYVGEEAEAFFQQVATRAKERREARKTKK
jgi:hypothetical protein